jgi:hypothetical protein
MGFRPTSTSTEKCTKTGYSVFFTDFFFLFFGFCLSWGLF